ncbi:hypothetical protein CDD83_3286 [Cordyceps sp. RAO-2017]|nr:hypothetical protein CDD83_3286 [Cordyceps sp. RAO-2017]
MLTALLIPSLESSRGSFPWIRDTWMMVDELAGRRRALSVPAPLAVYDGNAEGPNGARAARGKTLLSSVALPVSACRSAKGPRSCCHGRPCMRRPHQAMRSRKPSNRCAAVVALLSLPPPRHWAACG